MPIPINCAVEDELSEAVIRRLVADVRRDYAVGAVYRQGGFGYLRRTIHGWNTAARGVPFVVLTDLDNRPCAPDLINDWLPNGKHPNLLFRIAVREVESWLLADRAGLAAYLACNPKLVPTDPDALRDPKAELISLARKSRSSAIRAQLVPRKGSTATEGREYNSCLVEFVARRWHPLTARKASPSLHRTIERLKSFAPVWES